MTRQDATWLFVSRGVMYGLLGGAVSGGSVVCVVAALTLLDNAFDEFAYLRVSVPLGLLAGATAGYALVRHDGRRARRWIVAGALAGGVLGSGYLALFGLYVFAAGGIYGGLAGLIAGLAASFIVSAFVALRHVPLIDSAVCRREVTAAATLAGFALAGPALILFLSPDSFGWPTPAGLLWMAGLGLLGAPWGGWAGRRAVDSYIAVSMNA
jgi:hypothetical protein